MRLFASRPQFLIFSQMLSVLVIHGTNIPIPRSIIGRSVLQKGGGEVRCGVGEGAGGDGVLVIAKASLSAKSAVILVLVVHVMCLVAVILPVKALVHAHLIVLVGGAAIEHAMVLSMAVVVVHVAVRRRVCARRPVRRGRVCVRLE